MFWNKKQQNSGQAGADGNTRKVRAAAPLDTRTGGQGQEKKASLDGYYPGLNGLSWFIGYLEQLLAVISEPLLIFCASLAVIDFITGGQLLKLPLLNYLWAGSLAVSVTACFIVMWRKSIRAFTLNRYGASIGLAIIGVLLGIVDFSAIAVQTAQQTLNISFEQSLQLLNLNVVLITYLRSGVTIAMAVIVALSNHTAVTTAKAPARRLKIFDQWLDNIAPVVGSDHLNTAQKASDQIVSDQPGSAQLSTAQIKQKQPTRLHVVTSPAQLSSIEQAMYKAIMQSDQSGQLLQLSQEQDLITFTDTLKARYSEYASYITPERVAHVLSVATAKNAPAQIVGAAAPIERVRQALMLEPDCSSDRRLATLTGLAPATAKKYRLQLEQEQEQAM